MIRSALVLIVVCLAAGCPPSGAPQPVPPGTGPGTGYQSGAPVGAACDEGSDCGSGVCEGEGCGAAGGHCVAASRACTKDLREYCGCDGATFNGSGSCPGARYSHPGACEPAAPVGKADGTACTGGNECASGLCEGQGCDDSAPGVCVSDKRMCTMDARQYCGCDLESFTASGTCPGRRYLSKGPCAPPAPKASGESCVTGTDCASGMCEGEGCGDSPAGICVEQTRKCTRDARAYCGCDGKTFKGSGSCPARRFAHKGVCEPASR